MRPGGRCGSCLALAPASLAPVTTSSPGMMTAEGLVPENRKHDGPALRAMCWPSSRSSPGSTRGVTAGQTRTLAAKTPGDPRSCHDRPFGAAVGRAEAQAAVAAAVALC